ncbi:SDR family NAD(P)-dependent oxidoreductase [Nocardia terpenica]|uniref:SDR family NAD(P)-dependent oxidoreductase n=1 Tax=Nocardia terpenica TaxID=455432 RepID=A0A6G9Z8Z6_9NOCA|nr:SDR family NAD(P)-dependent oxidoreductase [Nocardia terpenica]QIS21934.1 SDR family NAD(P)-dependent oxidoreductase [Nocardia terpenica]
MSEVVLVTGAASGIGAAVARRFAAGGAHVVVADIAEEAGQAVAAEIGGLFVRTDVGSEQDNRAAVEAAVTTFGALNVVHLNAGIGGGGDELDLDWYRRIVAVNLDGPVLGIRAALPALRAAGGGAIVVTASLAGVAPFSGDPIYSATKHAVVALVRSLAPKYRESGVTINALCPGVVDTPILPEEAKEFVRESGLALASPAYVAAAVERMVREGETGQAWEVQAGKEPAPIEFPRFELTRTKPDEG